MQVLARYEILTEGDITTLVVDDRWLASVRHAVDELVGRLIADFGGRLRELQERYAHALSELERRVDKCSSRVEVHLRHMGLSL